MCNNDNGNKNDYKNKNINSRYFGNCGRKKKKSGKLKSIYKDLKLSLRKILEQVDI